MIGPPLLVAVTSVAAILAGDSAASTLAAQQSQTAELSKLRADVDQVGLKGLSFLATDAAADQVGMTASGRTADAQLEAVATLPNLSASSAPT